MSNQKTTTKELLEQHGPTGGLIRTLQRYALLGWGLFAVTLLGHFLIVALSTLSPKPVVVVNEGGTVLGVLEYLSPASRSDDELIAGCKRFTGFYMSLNAATIFDDYAQAMNMMDGPFLEYTMKALKEDNYLARVADAKARSWIDFDRDGVQLFDRHDMGAQCRLAGSINIDTGSPDGPTVKPFDITLGVQIVARNSQNTSGIKIISRKDN